MRRTITVALAGSLGALLLAACGGAAGGPTQPPAPNPAGGATADETARAYLAAWEREDAAALAALFTPDARALWALGGGMSKRLQDKRRAYGSPIPGQGRVLAVEEHGGTGVRMSGGLRLRRLRALYAARLAAAGPRRERRPAHPGAAGDGRWLITYIEGSSYLGGAGPGDPGRRPGRHRDRRGRQPRGHRDRATHADSRAQPDAAPRAHAYTRGRGSGVRGRRRPGAGSGGPSSPTWPGARLAMSRWRAPGGRERALRRAGRPAGHDGAPPVGQRAAGPRANSTYPRAERSQPARSGWARTWPPRDPRRPRRRPRGASRPPGRRGAGGAPDDPPGRPRVAGGAVPGAAGWAPARVPGAGRGAGAGRSLLAGGEAGPVGPGRGESPTCRPTIAAAGAVLARVEPVALGLMRGRRGACCSRQLYWARVQWPRRMAARAAEELLEVLTRAPTSTGSYAAMQGALEPAGARSAGRRGRGPAGQGAHAVAGVLERAGGVGLFCWLPPQADERALAALPPSCAPPISACACGAWPIPCARRSRPRPTAGRRRGRSSRSTSCARPPPIPSGTRKTSRPIRWPRWSARCRSSRASRWWAYRSC